MPPLFHPDVPLTALNTFGLVARARRLATLSDEAQLPAVLADDDFRHGPRLLLGGGSNLLLTHTEVNASVLRIATRASACWPTMANRCRWRLLRANPGMVLFATPCNTAGLAWKTCR